MEQTIEKTQETGTIKPKGWNVHFINHKTIRRTVIVNVHGKTQAEIVENARKEHNLSEDFQVEYIGRTP